MVEQTPQRHQAWRLLHEGQLDQACAAFDQLPPMDQALGYARAATRFGQFNTALAWIRLGFSLTYRQENHADHALFHGALGELLVRGARPESALLHMQIANSLRPKGHLSRQKQMSFLAIPLARLGKIELAESYYMRAYVLAKQHHDEVGMSHALARRAMLSLHASNAAYWQQSKRLVVSLSAPCQLAMAIINLVAIQQEGKPFDHHQGIDHSIEWCLHQRLGRRPLPGRHRIQSPTDTPSATRWLKDICLDDVDFHAADINTLFRHIFA